MAYSLFDYGLAPNLRSREEEEAANATPVTQTLTTNPVTGEQTMTIKGSPQDLSAENPLTPTVLRPSEPAPAPVMPAAAAPQAVAPMPDIGQPPQPGPGVQLAGPMVPGAMPGAAPSTVPGGTTAENFQWNPATRTNEPIAAPAAPAAAPQAAAPQAAAPQAAAPAAAPATETPVMAQYGRFADAYTTAKGDPLQLLTLAKDESFSPGQRETFRREAQGIMAGDLKKRQTEEMVRKEYQQATQTGQFSNLAKMLRSEGEEGSYAKMIMLGFISPELAGAEARKLGLADKKVTTQVVGADGKMQDVLVTMRDGVAVKGINAETGNELSPQELIKASTGSMGKLNVVGGTYVNDKTGEVGRVVTDEKTGRSYVQTDSGRKPMTGFRPQASTGTLDMQRIAQIQRTNVDLAADWAKLQMRVQGAAPEAANKYLGEFNAKFGMNVPLSGISGPPPQIALESGQMQGVAPAAQATPAAPQGAVAPTPMPAQAAPAQAAPAQAAPAPAPAAPAQAAPAAPLNVQRRPAATGGAATGRTPAQVEAAQTLSTEAGKARIGIEAAVEETGRKPAAEAKGKVEVKTIQEQDTANRSYPIMQEVNALLAKSTGSGIGAKVDDLARIIGSSPDGAQVIAQLQPLAGRLVSYVPRFEGAQSDRDVIMYQKQAGDFANPKLPVKERLAALQGLATLMKIYDKEGKNDWGIIVPAAPQTPADRARAELERRRGQR